MQTNPVQYIVGIDLGTTNSALAYTEIESSQHSVKTLPIPQLVAPNVTEARTTLPSFLYQPEHSEDENAHSVVGTFARDFGAKNPNRLIVSAKSWLCHNGVDRTAALLPWGADGDVTKISPVEASSRYLKHIRTAWNAKFPQAPLAEQEIVLTLPASFDEIARELTIQAAKKAGLPRVVLVEEPQAAFYCWGKAEGWRLEAGGLWEEKIGEIQKSSGMSTDSGCAATQTKKNSFPKFKAPSPQTPSPQTPSPQTPSLQTSSPQPNASSLTPPASRLPPKKILICDIGGGTTDLTLILARTNADGQHTFQRVAVGEHLILGGDNLDLALAHYVEKKLAAKFSTQQWNTLVRLCCQLKETMLGESPPEKTTLSLSGGGSKRIGGSLLVEITRQEVETLLVDGFFPFVPLESKPEKPKSGFREFGLPYAADSAVTKYLAQFLTAHETTGYDAWERGHPARREGGKPATPECRLPACEPVCGQDARAPRNAPSFVLLNGGVFAAKSLQKRILDVLENWFGSRPILLENNHLDLAVAHGAVCYGLARLGFGEKVKASLARTYYVGFESRELCSRKNESRELCSRDNDCVCLLPAKAEAGEEIVLSDKTFELQLGSPVAFPIYVSSFRLADKAGEIFTVSDEEMRTLPPICTVLKTRRKKQKNVNVYLSGKLTEIGTLEINLRETDESAGHNKPQSWLLQFDVRSATQTDFDAHKSSAEKEGVLDDEIWENAKNCLDSVFVHKTDKPSQLMQNLAKAIQLERSQWPSTLLRRIGETLLELDAARRISPEHEIRWLNLLGYAFRPGFGLAMDDWRIEQLWRKLQGNLVHKTPACRSQIWILWRRIAGGLTAGQQQLLAEPILSNVRNLFRLLALQRGKGSDIDLSSQEGAEIWRGLGSFERLSVETKIELGEQILALLPKKKMQGVSESLLWALGRIGSRSLLYGPLNAILPPNIVEKWLLLLIENQVEHFSIVAMSRKTGDRYLDISENVRKKVLAHMRKYGVSERVLGLIQNVSELTEKEEAERLGDSLPIGLRLS